MWKFSSVVGLCWMVCIAAACEDRVYRPPLAQSATGSEPGATTVQTPGGATSNPSTNQDGGVCMVRVTAGEEDALDVQECSIDVRSMTACDDLARCLCASEFMQGQLESTEQCMSFFLQPRGAISWADLCTASGVELPNTPEGRSLSVLEDVSGFGLSFEYSPTCEQVAPFSAEVFGAQSNREVEDDFAFLSIPEAGIDPSLTQAMYPMPLNRFRELSSRFGSSLMNHDIAHVYQNSGDFVLKVPLEGDLFIDPFLDASSGYFVPVRVKNIVLGVAFVNPTAMDGFWWLRLDEILASSREEGGLISRFRMDPNGVPWPRSFWVEFAAQRRLADAVCISSCGCPDEFACEGGVCSERVDGCERDEDCCLGSCSDGQCVDF